MYSTMNGCIISNHYESFTGIGRQIEFIENKSVLTSFLVFSIKPFKCIFLYFISFAYILKIAKKVVLHTKYNFIR